MDMILLFKALIMGVVEGLTEFLPVSSTGHLIITGSVMSFWEKDKRDVFEIAIQFAAILAVCWEYRVRLINVVKGITSDKVNQQFAINLIVAFLPAVVIGVAIGSKVKQYLFNPVTVSIALVVGGFLILWAEKRNHTVRVQEVDDMTVMDAMKLGFMQCLAFIPGTSRSGATIIGGLLFGLSRKAATEFSFFLAIPTLFAATLHEVYGAYKSQVAYDAADIDVFIVGSIASFISAFIAVKGLLRFIQRHDFTAFAWYRIIFGITVLTLAYTGHLTWE